MNGKKVQDDDDDVIDLTEHSRQKTGSPSGPESEAVEYAPSSSPAASRPPSSATDFDDDFDMDAVIREEEERSAKERATSSAQIAQLKTNVQSRAAEDEDEALWNMFDDIPASKPPTRPPLTSVNVNTDEDEDMWDVVQALENESAPPKASVPPEAIGEPMIETSIGEAEEGWDDVYG